MWFDLEQDIRELFSDLRLGLESRFDQHEKERPIGLRIWQPWEEDLDWKRHRMRKYRKTESAKELNRARAAAYRQTEKGREQRRLQKQRARLRAKEKKAA